MGIIVAAGEGSAEGGHTMSPLRQADGIMLERPTIPLVADGGRRTADFHIEQLLSVLIDCHEPLPLAD